ncbi:hypothetical protein [Caulobacter endophyticus]|uniref:hypothetical protein n=1 Tax=Caulobacter endophyticus TaxID=2172652 RepID=UPI0024103A1E|nr:hypothetical protein [Caulobacter endophyticus]MDG2527535.1 hypothetical protein [Caulobacter endophyticus]
MIRPILSWLGGRGRRREYWFGFAGFVALLAASRITGDTGSSLLIKFLALLAWMLLSARRLRDIGWPAWLALFPLLMMGLGVAQVIISLTGKATVLMTGIIGWSWLAFIIVIGAWKPRPADITDPERQAEVFG